MDSISLKTKEQYQVSVVVPTYNSDLRKLFFTLFSIIEQKGITFEIIISDDGSECFRESGINAFFKRHSFEDFVINANAVNRGTVRNILSAFLLAKGEYIACLSPGDMLFDDSTLEVFYRYAVDNCLEICFGNAICFGERNGKYEIFDYKFPKKPELYNSTKIIKELASHQKQNYINGTTFFRKRASAIETIRWVSEHSKYVEDTTSLQYYLALEDRIGYLNKNFTWYEKGGISTSENKEWTEALINDIDNTLTGLEEEFPKDRVIRFVSYKKKEKNRLKVILYGLFHWPFVLLGVLFIRIFGQEADRLDKPLLSAALSDKIEEYSKIISKG